MNFSNKVVIVTGASSGIGAATAQLFSHRGADVVLVGRNKTKLNNVAEKCAQGGSRPLVVTADVGNDQDAERIIEEAIKRYGKLDILVNNAGIKMIGHILDGNLLQAYDDIMKVNIRAVVNLTVLAAPYLIKSKGGIINISSTEGKKILMMKSLAYPISKAALDHFTRGAALELAPFGVRVNSVSPGPVKTDTLDNMNITWDDIGKLVLLQRVSEPEEIGELILYLASDNAAGITGSDLHCDNGCSLKNNLSLLINSL